jgi:hypothetical protein
LPDCEKFLILGCQRSGTTLLGMALQAHPGIDLIEENNPRFHNQYALTKQLNLHAVKEYAPEGCELVGFKSPRDSHRCEEIIRTIPRVRIVWISREIYQVVASMVSLRTGPGSVWALDFAPREIIKYLYAEKEDHELAEQYGRARSLGDARQRAIALATVCWIAKQRSELKAIGRWPERTSRLSYDNLVTKPGDTLSRLLEFLGIHWDPAVLDHAGSLSGTRPGRSNTSRAIDSGSVTKWKKELSGDELQLVDLIAQEIHQIHQ